MPKTILITGATNGFGRDMAETPFRTGHTVYASMRGAHGNNQEAAEALRMLGIKTVKLDVSDDASVEAGVEKVLAEAGKIDVLVNNAVVLSPEMLNGVITYPSLPDSAEWDRFDAARRAMSGRLSSALPASRYNAEHARSARG